MVTSTGKSNARRLAGHGQAPFGYRFQGGGLAIVESEACVVRRIYNWYVSGDETGRSRLTTRAIADKLNAMREPSPSAVRGVGRGSGESRWSAATVTYMLRNEIYAGLRCPDMTLTADEAAPAVVPAILREGIWDAAVRQRRSNFVNSPRNSHLHTQLG